MLKTASMLPKTSRIFEGSMINCRRQRDDGNGDASGAPQQGARALTPPTSQFNSMRHDGSATPPRSSHGGYDEEQAIGGSSRYLTRPGFQQLIKSPLCCVNAGQAGSQYPRYVS